MFQQWHKTYNCYLVCYERGLYHNTGGNDLKNYLSKIYMIVFTVVTVLNIPLAHFAAN